LIIGLIAGTLCILATFVILAAAFVGVGLILRRAFGLKMIEIDDCFLAFWTGFGVINVILILWNFIWPVGLSALLLVLSLGTAGSLWNRKALISTLNRKSWRPTRLQICLYLLAASWVANQCMAGFNSWDGGLYHLQAVKWAETFPVVPGIANLHGPLAFNNSSFLYDAMVDSGWWKGRGFHVANGVFVFVMVLQAITAGGRFVVAEQQAPCTQLYNFLLLAPALYLVPLNGGASSYSSELPLTLMLLAASAKIYDLLAVSGWQPATTKDAYGVFALSILLAAAVCIKLTAGVFAALAILIAVLGWWNRRPGSETGSTRALVWMSVAIFVFAAAWIARGVLMSGYPFFPLSIGGFPVDWRAPAEHADGEFAYLAFTEREFTWRIIGKNWLRQVFINDPYAVFIPAVLSAAALAGLYLLRASCAVTHERSRATWWLLLPILVAIGAWFVSAPSTRYCPALFWSMAALCLCEFQQVIWSRLTEPGRRWAIVAIVAVAVSPPVVMAATQAIRQEESAIGAFLRYNLVTPAPDGWFYPIAGQVELTTFETRFGLMLNVPKKQRNSESLPNACWDAPIPCTPNPAPNLELRQPERLDKGFRVQGGWQMQDWPYYWRPSFLSQWRVRRAETVGARSPAAFRS
jgi:hypothetical protein